MLTLLRLAARNLVRHARRTAITVLAISLGLALMVWSNNLSNGVHQEMLRSGISMAAGDVVVQAQGYQQEKEQELVVADASRVVSILREAVPEGTIVRRTFLQGLVTSPRNSVGIGLTAIDPDVEAEVSDWETKVVEGAFLDDRERGIVLGQQLADSLEVAVGDKVVVMTQGEDDVASRLYRVDGILRTGSQEMDGFLALVPIETTGELLGRADVATQISVHLPGVDAEALRDLVRGALADREDIEVLTWREALPELVQFIELDDAGNHVFMGVIAVIVGMGVLNTVLMSVMERFREFGVMLALGVGPVRVAGVVLIEGALIGLVSVALGTALGMALTWPLIVNGLDYTQLAGEQMDMAGISVSMIMYPVIDWPRTGVYAVFTVLITVLAALYPAVVVSRLRPVDAMRHV